MNGFEEKINWEYETFYLDIMRTSKANIFAKSKEIEIKKEIVCVLKNMVRKKGKESPELFEKLSGFDNVLDEVYRYIIDCPKSAESTAELLEKWLTALQ